MKATYIYLILTAIVVAGCSSPAMYTEIDEDGSGEVRFARGLINLEQLEPSLEKGEMRNICPSTFTRRNGAFFDDLISDKSTISSQYGDLYAEREDTDAVTVWCILSEKFDSLEILLSFYDRFSRNYKPKGEDDRLTVHPEFLGERNGKFIYDVILELPETVTFDMWNGGNQLGRDMGHAYWTVLLPGEIGDNNADKVIGNRLEWHILRTDFYAESYVNTTLPQDNNSNRETLLYFANNQKMAPFLAGNLLIAVTVFILL